jgi:hypothetical protein
VRSHAGRLAVRATISGTRSLAMPTCSSRDADCSSIVENGAVSIEERIDELYQLPLAEFTAARNALAKSLSGGDARRVRQLGKPTVVPWAVNQVYWRAPAVYEKLLKSGKTLRDAQVAALKGKASDVRRAAEAHRAAVSESVRHATRIAEAAGTHPAAEPLARMLEALSIAPVHPERPGRLTDLVQPAGFEALAGVTPAAPARREAPRNPAPPAPPVEAHAPASRSAPSPQRTADIKRARAEARRQAREAAARRRQQAAARKRAQAALARAEQAEAAARREVERAQERLRGAERASAEARASLRESAGASE